MTIVVADLPRSELAAASSLLARACAFDEAGTVAEEKLFGGSPAGVDDRGPLGAWDRGALVGLAAQAGRWLRLLAVDPAARGRGVGSALLEAAERRARAGGATRLRTGDQPGNYLTPGVDERDAATLAWLEKRGFEWFGANANLRVPLAGNALVTPARAAELAAAARAAGYVVRRATAADAAAVEALAASEVRYWPFEVRRALANDPPAVHVAALADGGAVVAFAAHDGNNRGLGWFGPAATLPAHRGRGLGAALLVPCLLDVAAAGRDEGVIAWVGPSAFYERAVGADDGRHFVVMEKALA